MSSDQLEERRMAAALASKGISGSAIRTLVLSLIERETFSSLLDYGAGTGELLGILHQRYPEVKLAGTDILPQPESLPTGSSWYQQDLNREFELQERFDLVISTEVIEHLENPRATFRTLHRLLNPGGRLILTTPHQNSIRSVLALAMGGHFAAFLGASYPAHITALTVLDLRRIAEETGLCNISFAYSGRGGIPKMPRITWQKISFGLLKGAKFSDNVALTAQRPA